VSRRTSARALGDDMKLLWACIFLLIAWLAITHRANVPAHITFWTGTLLLVALLAAAWRAYGGRGLLAAVGVALVMALADGALPVFGKTGQWVFTIAFVLTCVCIYSRRVYLRRKSRAESVHEARKTD
jgi:hypothetical protein